MKTPNGPTPRGRCLTCQMLTDLRAIGRSLRFGAADLRQSPGLGLIFLFVVMRAPEGYLFERWLLTGGVLADFGYALLGSCQLACLRGCAVVAAFRKVPIKGQVIEANLWGFSED